MLRIQCGHFMVSNQMQAVTPTNPPQPLSDALRVLRRRVRRAAFIYGGCTLISVLAMAVWCVGVVDWAIHLDDVGTRTLLGIGLLILVGIVAWRYCVRALFSPLTDHQLALWMERCFPELRGLLASTIQFSRQSADSRIGSAELQRRMIQQTMHAISKRHVDDIVDYRPVLRIGLLAGAIGLLMTFTIWTYPIEAGIALERLMFPFSVSSWPRRTELTLLQADFEPVPLGRRTPLRLVRGSFFEVFVKNRRGVLPRDLRLEYRVGDDVVSQEISQHVTRRDSGGVLHEFGLVTIPISQGPLELRAIGGDHRNMAWHMIDVVSPPTIEKRTVTVRPPRYTRRSIETLPNGIGSIRGLVGSTVAINATLNRPISSATLMIDGKPVTDVETKSAKRQLSLEFQIPREGRYGYRIELQDQEGLTNINAPTCEIVGIADRPPEVSLENLPASLSVTPQAIVPFRILANDDLGLSDVQLHRRIPRQSNASMSEDSASEGDDEIELLKQCDASTTQLCLDHACDLASWSADVGMQIAIHVEATDHCDLTSPHVGRSVRCTLRVVSAEQKMAELAERQGGLLEELNQITQLQERAQRQTSDLLQDSDTFQWQDSDRLKRIELDQRQIATRLFDAANGLQSQVLGILHDMQINRLQNVQTRGLMNELIDELETLHKTSIATIDEALARTREGTQWQGFEALASNSRELSELDRLHQAQSAAFESLTRLQYRLGQATGLRDLSADLDQVVREQEALNRDTVTLGRRMLNRLQSGITSDELVQTAQLHERQQALAERLAQYQRQLTETRQTAGDTPAGASPVTHILTQLDQDTTVGLMREAADQLADGRVGQATTLQQRVLEQLQGLLASLQENRVTDTDVWIARLTRIEGELNALRQRQQLLCGEATRLAGVSAPADVADTADRLARDQRDMSRQADAMADRLRRLAAYRAANATRRAGTYMSGAAESLQHQRWPYVTATHSQAIEAIKQAAKELVRLRGVAEEQLRRERLESLTADIADWIPREQAIVDSMSQLQQEHRQRVSEEKAAIDSWKRSEARNLRQLATDQSDLAAEVNEWVENLHDAPAFSSVLDAVARRMTSVAERLDARNLEPQTLAKAREAKRRLAEALASDTQNDSVASDQARAKKVSQLAKTHKPFKTDESNDATTQAENNNGDSPTTSQASDRDTNKVAGQESQGRESSRSAESSQSEDAASRFASQRREVADGIWGHLPAILRRRVLNVSAERAVPDYEENVRRYFEALAHSPTTTRLVSPSLDQ